MNKNTHHKLPCQKNIETNIYLSITRKCNLACPYCYCKEVLSDRAIPSIRKINLFIAHVKKTSNIGIIGLVGGEPLINKKHILYLLDKLQIINQNRVKKFKIRIITNGTCYFNLKKYKSMLQIIQISLNGYREEHNQTRKYKKDGTGSFDDIIRNYQKYRHDKLPVKFHCVATLKTIGNTVVSLDKVIKKVNFTSEDVINIQINHMDNWKKHFGKLIKLHFDVYAINKKYHRNVLQTHASTFSSESVPCRAGTTTFYGVDLVSGQIHGCHEHNGSTEDIIGSLKNGLNLNIVNKNYTDLNIRLYRYSGLPKFLSFWLFKYLGAPICQVRNQYHCKNKFIVPTYHLYMRILGHLLKIASKKWSLPYKQAENGRL